MFGSGFGFSQSGSADATNAGTIGGSYFGGIQTGGGNSLLVVAVVALVLVLVLKR